MDPDLDDDPGPSIIFPEFPQREDGVLMRESLTLGGPQGDLQRRHGPPDLERDRDRSPQPDDRPARLLGHRQVELEVTLGHPAAIAGEGMIRLDPGRLATDERLAEVVDGLDRPGRALLGEPHPGLDHHPELDEEPGLMLPGRGGIRSFGFSSSIPSQGPAINNRSRWSWRPSSMIRNGPEIVDG